MKHQICVLGAFGFNTTLYDGQTIKTRNLLTLLQNHNKDVAYFDVQNCRTSKLSYFRMFKTALTCKYLYYLPAQNNLAYLFPILYYLTKLFGVRIHYFVVGGWLVEFIENKPLHRKLLSRITGIHCETLFMKNALEEKYGYKNVDVFPNFRINDFKPMAHHEEGRLKLVFMARVIKMKGLDLIFKLGDAILEKGLNRQILIDFYGPQQNHEDDIAYFNTNLVKYNFMKYYGPLEPSDIYHTLEKYDAMLLPTHFYTEGFPGSILDAYISGIPVIVTKWKHATEFVDDGGTGLIIPFEDDGTGLIEAVLLLFENTDLLNYMKTKARRKWNEFSSEKAFELIQNYK